MTPFASDQWVMLALVFLLGLFIGMMLRSGGRWKRRYHEEVARREALERDYREAETLRGAAARDSAVRDPADRDSSMRDPDRRPIL